jgi:hypothetical protein
MILIIFKDITVPLISKETSQLKRKSGRRRRHKRYRDEDNEESEDSLQTSRSQTDDIESNDIENLETKEKKKRRRRRRNVDDDYISDQENDELDEIESSRNSSRRQKSKSQTDDEIVNNTANDKEFDNENKKRRRRRRIKVADNDDEKSNEGEIDFSGLLTKSNSLFDSELKENFKVNKTISENIKNDEINHVNRLEIDGQNEKDRKASRRKSKSQIDSTENTLNRKDELLIRSSSSRISVFPSKTQPNTTNKVWSQNY